MPCDALVEVTYRDITIRIYLIKIIIQWRCYHEVIWYSRARKNILRQGDTHKINRARDLIIQRYNHELLGAPPWRTIWCQEELWIQGINIMALHRRVFHVCIKFYIKWKLYSLTSLIISITTSKNRTDIKKLHQTFISRLIIIITHSGIALGLMRHLILMINEFKNLSFSFS